jgi:hypothetical protein
MKKIKISKSLLALIGVLLVTIGLSTAVNIDNSYWDSIQSTKVNLLFARRSIRLFAEQNGRFPDSLQELNEYGRKFPEKIQWYFAPRECISQKPSNSCEHSALDGTGGLYYDPQKGALRVNLTKSLKSYWPFYFREKRNEIPAEW